VHPLAGERPRELFGPVEHRDDGRRGGDVRVRRVLDEEDAPAVCRTGTISRPNTGGPGYTAFNRYYYARQDKDGAIIDERITRAAWWPTTSSTS
jgi:hypothetical protein